MPLSSLLLIFPEADRAAVLTPKPYLKISRCRLQFLPRFFLFATSTKTNDPTTPSARRPYLTVGCFAQLFPSFGCEETEHCLEDSAGIVIVDQGLAAVHLVGQFSDPEPDLPHSEDFVLRHLRS